MNTSLLNGASHGSDRVRPNFQRRPHALGLQAWTNQNSVLDDRKYQKCENLPF